MTRMLSFELPTDGYDQDALTFPSSPQNMFLPGHRPLTTFFLEHLLLKTC